MASEEGGRSKLQTTELPKIVLNRLTDRLSGMETLDLSVAEPEPTRHLALGKGNNVRFQRKTKETPQGSAWQLDARDDELKLILTLPYKHGVNLILELCRTEPAQTDAPPVLITVNNEHELDIEINPNNLNFQKQAWYLPQYMLEKGENRITLKLAPEAGTEVLLRSVSVMRFDLQPQEKTQWCWAAVTASLINFFADDDPITQDKVVHEYLEDIEEKDDNRTLVITNALDNMELRTIRCNYAISLDEVRRQMLLGLPVAIRIQWKGGTTAISSSLRASVRSTRKATATPCCAWPTPAPARQTKRKGRPSRSWTKTANRRTDFCARTTFITSICPPTWWS